MSDCWCAESEYNRKPCYSRSICAQAASYEQLDLFTDYAALEKQQAAEEAELEREKEMQKSILDIKKKFGRTQSSRV